MGEVTLDFTKNNMSEEKEQGLIRAILRNEITWVITFIGITIGFFNMVVLPLNDMRIQLTAIQKDLAAQSSQTESLRTAVGALNTAVSVLQTRVDTLSKHQ